MGSTFVIFRLIESQSRLKSKIISDTMSAAVMPPQIMHNRRCNLSVLNLKIVTRASNAVKAETPKKPHIYAPPSAPVPSMLTSFSASATVTVAIGENV